MNRALRWMFFVAAILLPATISLAAEAAEPQQESLVKGPNESLITAVTTLIIFVVLVVVLGKAAWGPIVEGLKKRESKIRGDIAEAEATRARAEATLKQYNDQLAAAEQRARDMITKAASEGERMAAQIRTHAQQEAEETRERALRDIEAARAQALLDIYQQTATLATSVAEKILRRNLNPDDQRDLVNQSLEQIQAVATH